MRNKQRTTPGRLFRRGPATPRGSGAAGGDKPKNFRSIAPARAKPWTLSLPAIRGKRLGQAPDPGPTPPLRAGVVSNRREPRINAGSVRDNTAPLIVFRSLTLTVKRMNEVPARHSVASMRGGVGPVGTVPFPSHGRKKRARGSLEKERSRHQGQAPGPPTSLIAQARCGALGRQRCAAGPLKSHPTEGAKNGNTTPD